MGLSHANSDRRVTVVSGVANNRYRVQSNDASSSTLIVRRLIDRSARRKGEGENVGANHVRSVHQGMDDHFAARREIEEITVRYMEERRDGTRFHAFPFSRIERDRIVDQSVEKYREKDGKDREREERAIVDRHRPTLPLRIHVQLHLRAPRGSRQGTRGKSNPIILAYPSY